MTNATDRQYEHIALLPYKDEITTLAKSLKEALGTDVVVVDKYLNRLVNTFQYEHNTAEIRINSVVGNIITTQKLQMIYDRKYFTDCVNCPDFMTCELGGVFGTPIMCDGECIGAIALLVGPNRLISFQQKHKQMMEFLQQISVLISQMVQNTYNSQRLQATSTKFHGILSHVNEAIAVTDLSGVVAFANGKFWEFFSAGQPSPGTRIDELFTRWKNDTSDNEKHSLIDNLFYKKGQQVIRLRGIQNIDSGEGTTMLLYVFDPVDTVAFFRYQTRNACSPDILDTFFGKSPAMEKARQGVIRALHNQLSILVESPDKSQADELAKILCLHLRQDSQQILKIDCSEDDRILEAALLGQGEEFPSALSFHSESVVCLYRIDCLPLYLQKALANFLRGCWDNGKRNHMRVIAVSYQDLYSLVRQGRFSTSLYSMISRNKITLPLVGFSPEDVRFYLDKYLTRYCAVYQHAPIQIAPDAWRILEKRHWEDGVQEIRTTAERIVRQLQGSTLTSSDVAVLFPEEEPSPKGRGSVEEGIEAQLRSLLKVGMTKEKMAEELGISRATLYRWLDKFKLNVSQ